MSAHKRIIFLVSVISILLLLRVAIPPILELQKKLNYKRCRSIMDYVYRNEGDKDRLSHNKCEYHLK